MTTKNNNISVTITDIGNNILVAIRRLLPAVKVNNIVILGMRGAGKTTLWHRLGGLKEVRSNTTINRIPSFTFQLKNGRRVKVVYENEKYKSEEPETGKHRGKKKNGGIDIGGEDPYTAEYETLIVPNSFIYYIADATKIHEDDYCRKMRSDFRKIDSVIRDKNIKEKQFGFKVLLSHYDEWEKLHPESEPTELYSSFFDKMNGIIPDGPVRSSLCSKNNHFLQEANLLDNNYIERIKEEISKV